MIPRELRNLSSNRGDKKPIPNQAQEKPQTRYNDKSSAPSDQLTSPPRAGYDTNYSSGPYRVAVEKRKADQYSQQEQDDHKQTSLNQLRKKMKIGQIDGSGDTSSDESDEKQHIISPESSSHNESSEKSLGDDEYDSDEARANWDSLQRENNSMHYHDNSLYTRVSDAQNEVQSEVEREYDSANDPSDPQTSYSGVQGHGADRDYYKNGESSERGVLEEVSWVDSPTRPWLQREVRNGKHTGTIFDTRDNSTYDETASASEKSASDRESEKSASDNE